MLSLSCSAIASKSASALGHVGRGEDLPHLVREHLDPEPGDEAGHHGAREEVGEEGQAEGPEDEEDRRAEEGQGEGVLQPQRVPGRGEGDQGGADQGGHRGVRAGHEVTRAREQREDDQRDDGRVQAGHGRQAGHLGVADVQRDHQGGQGDPGHRLPGDVFPRDPLEPCEGTRPTHLVRARLDPPRPCASTVGDRHRFGNRKMTAKRSPQSGPSSGLSA